MKTSSTYSTSLKNCENDHINLSKSAIIGGVGTVSIYRKDIDYVMIW